MSFQAYYYYFNEHLWVNSLNECKLPFLTRTFQHRTTFNNTFLVFFILYQSINASYERITRAPMFKSKHALKLVSQKTALDRSYLALQWHWCFLKHRSFCMYPQWLSYLGTAQFRRITSTARWFLCLGFPNSQQMLIKVQQLQHAQTNWAINWNQHIAHQNIPGKESNFASSL